jgi:hypothetical protein
LVVGLTDPEHVAPVLQDVTESATTTLLLVTVVVEPPSSMMLKVTGLGSAPFGSFTVFAVYV